MARITPIKIPGCQFDGDRISAEDSEGRLTEQSQEILGIWDSRARIKVCLECGDHFVGHFARATCSDDCQQKRLKDSNNLIRDSRRANYRKAAKCDHCSAPLINRQRLRTNSFCSARCRVAFNRRLTC